MTKLAFISDIHYYSAKLGTTGRAYELREGSDQKCLKETRAIVEALVGIFEKDGSDAVVIPGDVTNDGERESHEEFIELLDTVKKPVYVITSTHDWCSDGHARRFEGSEVLDHTNTVSKEELPSLYEHFGREQEISRYENGIGQFSRSFNVNNEVLLIAVNDDCDGPGGSSGYTEEHLAWMKSQIEYAKANGLSPIALEHHLVLSNISPIINKGQSIGARDEIAVKLADMGLKLLITGHSHIQRTSTFTSENGNTLTQLNVGSISGYPGLITYISVEDGKATINEEPFEFEYEGQTLGTEYLKEHSTGIFTRIIHSGANDKEDFLEILSSNGISTSKISLLYPVIRKLCNMAETITVGKAAKKVNRLVGKGSIDMKNVESVKDDLLMPHLKATFLNVFWWGGAESQSEDVKQIVLQIGRLPAKLFTRFVPKKKREGAMKLASQIEALTVQLEYPEKNPDSIKLI